MGQRRGDDNPDIGGAEAVADPAEPPLLNWLATSWPNYPWSRAELRHACFHDVAILAPEVVARVSRHGEQEARLRREHATLDSVAAVPMAVAVPRTLSRVVARDGRAGMLTTYLPGEPRPDIPWATAAGPIAAVLRALSGADIALVRHRLPAPRAWCGGSEWPDLVRERLAPHLPADLSPVAIAAVDAALEAEQGIPPTLVHGIIHPRPPRVERPHPHRSRDPCAPRPIPGLDSAQPAGKRRNWPPAPHKSPTRPRSAPIHPSRRPPRSCAPLDR